MRLKTITFFFAFIVLVGCSDKNDNERANTPRNPAVQIVSVNLTSNKLGIRDVDLLSKPNPKGEGTFVYVSKTNFEGVERNIIWLVIDDQVFPLNGATKGIVTSSLPWPREADPQLWSRTGLDPYMATEAIKIVFGNGY